MEIHLANAQKELDESKEEVRKKSEQINELEIKLDVQMKQQNEMEVQKTRDVEEKSTVINQSMVGRERVIKSLWACAVITKLWMGSIRGQLHELARLTGISFFVKI